MFRNGIYKIAYYSPGQQEFAADHALAVMRDGRFIGSDPLGGFYTGSSACGPSYLDVMTIELTMPPGGELVTGLIAGPSGATIKVRAELDASLNTQCAIVDVAGMPVHLQVTYLGPIPE